MLLALLITIACAGDRDAGWVDYLYDTQRYDEAAALAEDLLRADPSDLLTHRIYARVRGKGMREGAVVVAEYRAWLLQAPGDEVRKVALAHTLIERSGKSACEEVGALLMPLPLAPEIAWEAVSALRRAKRDESCPPQPTTDQVQALRAQVGAHPSVPKTLDDAGADTLRDLWERYPRRIGSSMWLWKGHYDGPALKRARRDALEAMDRIIAGDDAPAIKSVSFAAYQGGEAAHQRIGAAHARLDVLDPGWSPDRMHLGDEREAFDAMWQANSHVDPARALQRLDALANTIDETGIVRAHLERLRAERLDELGRKTEHVDALEAAWRAAPEDAAHAPYFAYEAYRHRHALTAGLEAIDMAIRRHSEATHDSVEWPWLTSYSAWADGHLERANRLIDLHNDLAGRIGSRMTAPIPPPPPLSGRRHLLIGLEQPTREGNRHLVRAAVSTDNPLVRETSKRALGEREAWFLAGMDAHLAAWESGPNVADAAWSAAHHRFTLETADHVGEVLGDVVFEVEGEARRLSDYTGIRVVEVWATWCGPCVPALADLDVVAREYESRGVTVIAIGTDETRAPIDNALEGTSLDLIIGWAADGGTQTDVRSIPVTFVIDPRGKILDQLDGLRDFKPRLRGALDAALDAP